MPVDRTGHERVASERPAEHVLSAPVRRPAAPLQVDAGSTPISASIETRSSLAMLPVAPAGTGQPPSSPKLDSKLSTPASSAASTFARPWPRVLWKCAVSSTPAPSRSRARAEELANLAADWPCPSYRRSRSPPRRRAQPRGDLRTRCGGDVSLVGAAERRRDHALDRSPLAARAAEHRLESPRATPRSSGSRSCGCASRRPTGRR